jgi:hypothetical protein
MPRMNGDGHRAEGVIGRGIDARECAYEGVVVTAGKVFGRLIPRQGDCPSPVDDVVGVDHGDVVARESLLRHGGELLRNRGVKDEFGPRALERRFELFMQVDTIGGGDDLELRRSSIVGFARASRLALRRPGHLEG